MYIIYIYIYILADRPPMTLFLLVQVIRLRAASPPSYRVRGFTLNP